MTNCRHEAKNQTAAFLIDDGLKTHRRLGACVILVTQSPNDALGVKDVPDQTAAASLPCDTCECADRLWCIQRRMCKVEAARAKWGCDEMDAELEEHAKNA